MTHYDVHLLLGDSKARGTANHANISAQYADYKVVDPDILIARQHDGGAFEAPTALDITSGYWSVGPRIGHDRKAAGESNPLIVKRARSGGTLVTHVRPWVNGDDYSDLFLNFWEGVYNNPTYAGDTFSFRSCTIVLGANDGQSDAYIALWDPAGDNRLGQSIDLIRNDFGNIPVFLGQLGTNVSDVDLTPTRVSTIRGYYTDVAASRSRVYVVDETPYALDDGVHFTADGYMDFAGGITAAMAADGLAYDGMADLGVRGRVFSTLAEANTYASSAQTEHGDRDENPAVGGLGVRLGSDCRDPYPTTARSASVTKHANFDRWFMPTDSAMIAGTLDTDTNIFMTNQSTWVGA